MGKNTNQLNCEICVPFDYYAVPEYIVFTTESSEELESRLHVKTVRSTKELCELLPYYALMV